MTANLVLHWRLDALTPENQAVDSSDHHLNGTVAGHPQNQPDERFGSVLGFDGEADAVTVPDTPLLRLARYTVEAWLNPAARNHSAGVAGKPPADFRMVLGADGSVTHRFSTSAHDDEGHATGPGAVPPGAWRHIAIVNDGHTASIYLDGKQASSHPFSGDRTVAQVPLQVGTGGGAGTGYAGLLAHLRVYDGPLAETEIQRDMADDEAALAVFVRAHPLGFALTDVSGQPVLFIDDAPAGQPMTLALTNSSRQDIELQPLDGPPSAARHHLALHFRPGTLALPPQPAVTTPGWSLQADLDPATGGRVLYLACANKATILRGATQELALTGLTADGTAGTRATRVQLIYQRMRYAGETDDLTGQRLAFLDIINQRGRRQIPLAIGLVGGDRVLNDGVTPGTLRIRIANRSRDTPLSLKGASFTLSYDVQEANETHEWALSDAGQADRAVLGGLVADKVSADWAITRKHVGQRVEWTLTPSGDAAFGPDGSIVVTLSQVFALTSLGQAGIVIGWRDVPGYADGAVTLLAQKSPLTFTGQATGIGTVAPQGKLQIVDANSDPSGNTLILGPTAQSNLRLGYNQDYSWIQSHGGRPLALNAINNDVGIGTAQPASRLHVNLASSGTPVHAMQIDAQSFQTTANAAASHLLLVRDVSAGDRGNYFYIRGDGNVGVGTKNPAARLQVAGPGGTSVDLLVSGRMRSDSNDGGLYVAQDRFIGGFDTDKIGVWSANAWRLTVLKDGNVGVGKTNPGAKLEVAGTGGTSVDLVVNGRMRSDNNDGGLWVAQDRFVGGFDTSKIGIFNGGTFRLSVLNNGDIGVGTLQPASRLHVNVDSSAAPVHAMRIDVQSFQGTANARNSDFLLVRDVSAGDRGNYFYIRGDGSVGIGTTDTGNQRLCVQGPTWFKDDIFVSGRLTYWWGPDQKWKQVQNLAHEYAGSYDTTGPNISDVRLKTDLRPIRHALETVRRLRGIRYRWGDSGLEHFTRDIASSVSAGPDATEEQHRLLRQAERRKALEALAGDRVGLAAQDVEAVLPELVHQDEDGYKHVRYHHLAAVLIEAIKEQDAVVRALSARVAALDAGQPG